MSTPGGLNNLLLASAGGGAAGYEIERSLRFNSSDSAYLSRTPASAGNRKTWTWAGWVKRASLGVTNQALFCAEASSPYNIFGLTSTNGLRLETTSGVDIVTSAVFRDISAWMHIVLAVDTAQATAANRVKVYVNNSLQALSTAAYPTLNEDFLINNTQAHSIGRWNASRYFDGYLADIHFIDGQALDPTSFGEFDANGVWQPKAYTGTYGTNGFHLPFSDNSTAAALGTDTSGNGNDWTVNNLSVQAGNGNYISRVVGTPYSASYGIDRMFNGSTANSYLSGSGTTTWTPLSPISFTKFRANLLQASGSTPLTINWAGGNYVFTADSTSAPAAWVDLTANIGGPITSISWPYNGIAGLYVYAWEVDDVILVDSIYGAGNDSLVDTPTNYGTDTGAGGTVRGNYCTWNPLINGDTAANGNLDVTNDTARGTQKLLEYDAYWEITSTGGTTTAGIVSDGGTTNTTTVADGKTYGFKLSAAGSLEYINITDGGSFTSITTGLTGIQFPYASAASATTGSLNAGQRPFAATAPSGFKALCTTNLPASVVAKPSEVMDVKLYTGNGSTQTISGLGFSPDLVWGKERSGTASHVWMDVIRGNGVYLRSDTTNGDTANANVITSFDSNGFTLGTSSALNGSTNSYVAWCWDAGSSTVTNTQGSITSQVRANPSAGFSIVTYTGNGSAGATIGHGLGVAPQMIIVKNRDAADAWQVYHSANTANPETDYLVLNTTAATADALDRWNDTAPTSTVFSLGDGVEVNTNTEDYVAYCWTGLVGYTAASSYTGNGSADGPFVFTNMRPRWILIKRTDSTGNWTILDTAREGYNVDNDPLFPNLADPEGTTDLADILSNGFKLRSTDASVNASGGTYIYYAISEAAFKYSRGR